MKQVRKKKQPKVGRCAWCGHWGLVWGRWCKHAWKNKASVCRLYFNRWVRGKNEVAAPLEDDGGWRLLREARPWDMPGSSGRMRKVQHGPGWRD